MDFQRIKRLPPYVFNVVGDLKQTARRSGEDVIDFSMGNPDGPTPPHIVAKLVEASQKPANHRYSVSKGIYKLRLAICEWYKRRFDVDLDPDSEAVVTIGSKDGLAHLSLAVLSPGDTVLVPSPTYPIHQYGVVIAGADVISVPLIPGEDFLATLIETLRRTRSKPKMLIINFPHNPTTLTVELDFFERVVELAREHKLLVVHDIAYADLVFDGYVAPSILQVPGAKELAVEFFTLSKSYNMPGWRVGFCVGNPTMVAALARMKSYLDYGIFQPVQIAAIAALKGPQDCVEDIRRRYERRRNVLCDGLTRAGWGVQRPKATMFVWAEIPDEFQSMGSLDFSTYLMREAKVAVSPGIGFGEYGDRWVRFALIENEHRTRQAVRGIKKALAAGPSRARAAAAR
ncbi:MAG: alanine transaminase [bacterium]